MEVSSIRHEGLTGRACRADRFSNSGTYRNTQRMIEVFDREIAPSGGKMLASRRHRTAVDEETSGWYGREEEVDL
jgi:hypothetical protein